MKSTEANEEVYEASVQQQVGANYQNGLAQINESIGGRNNSTRMTPTISPNKN